MTLTAALIHTAIALAVIVGLVRGRHQSLYVIGFILPLQGLRVEVLGVGWQWARLLPLLLLLTYIIHPPPVAARRRAFPGGPLMLGLFMWTLLVSGYFFLFDSETTHLIDQAQRMGWGRAQTTLRHPIQYVVFLSYFGSAYLVAKLVDGQRDLHGIISGFVAGTLISLAFGTYQMVALRTPLPVIEIIHENAIIERTMNEIRLFGLGGEPKHTGASAVLALALLMAIQMAGQRAAAPTWKIVALLGGIALTLSTSSFVGLALLLGTVLTLSMLRNEGTALRRYVFAGMILAGVGSLFASTEIERVVDERISDRLFQGTDTISKYEPKDGAYVNHVLDEPKYLVAGHGAGGVDFYLVDHFRLDLLPKTTSITPTYTLTKVLSDIGIVGLMLLVLMLLTWWRAARANINPSVGATFILIGGLASLVAPYFTFILYLVLAGAFVGYYSSMAVPEAAGVPARRVDLRPMPHPSKV